MSSRSTLIVMFFITVCSFAFTASGQEFVREITASPGSSIRVVNEFGRIGVSVAQPGTSTYTLKATSGEALSESEIKFATVKNGTSIVVSPSDPKRRVDIVLTLPERTRLELKSREGEIRVEGNFEIIDTESDTGTIAVDVPAEDVRYELVWLASRPRFLSDFSLEPVKEKAAGKFQIKGRYKSEDGSEANTEDDVAPREVQLKTATQRGIVLINVPPSEVMADLRERPLTEAARAIIRSGDSVLMDAIRRAAPKYFGDYARTLPPARREPELARPLQSGEQASALKRATVHVTDNFNRAIPGLTSTDFELSEAGKTIEVVSIKPVEAPVNLVLLLDVSGSIENYVTFIRKAAREFVNTVDKKDRVSIITFRDDVQILANFTTDKSLLSASVDTFEAGGATAYYDALGYALSESLRPLKGERTAIVILTDGDDNRSFLPFESLIGAIEESGALIYPLYVPSSLIAASAASGFQDIDPLRNRHLTLNSKANGEGERLAKVSGGQYYPITQLSQIQTAYDDIVVQLRTAYDITYRVSDGADSASGDSAASRRLQLPRLRVKVKRENAFAQVGPVVPVSDR